MVPQLKTIKFNDALAHSFNMCLHSKTTFPLDILCLKILPENIENMEFK